MITIEEGRKAYNMSRRGSALEIYRMKSHEQLVAEFFAKCEDERPAETAAVFARHIVLSENWLDEIRGNELHAFGPEDSDEDEDINSMTAVASMVAHSERAEAEQLARLRGEPV